MFPISIAGHGFCRLDRPLALSGPKACIIIALFVCTCRKRLLKPTQSLNCTLRLSLLNSSLRFCNGSKTYCKAQAKSKLSSQNIMFCTRSRLSRLRVFSFRQTLFRKTLLAGTRVQSVRAACTFIELLHLAPWVLHS